MCLMLHTCVMQEGGVVIKPNQPLANQEEDAVRQTTSGRAITMTTRGDSCVVRVATGIGGTERQV